jgi:hypothetical protein
MFCARYERVKASELEKLLLNLSQGPLQHRPHTSFLVSHRLGTISHHQVATNDDDGFYSPCDATYGVYDLRRRSRPTPDHLATWEGEG